MRDTQHSPTTTRDQAAKIKEAWVHLGKTTMYGDLSLAELETLIGQLDAFETTMTQLTEQLASARNNYITTRHELWKVVKRTRSGVKAKHGDDSFEYERFGGTRMSNRRRKSSASKPSES